MDGRQYAQMSRGFTLVEMMVVMAIFGVVVMAIFSLLIPTQRSTATQTRVAELQQGMRLALRVMTQDLLNAGFLVIDEPIAFDPDSPADDQDFTIRTRIVGGSFGIVAADAGTGASLSLGDANLAVVSAIDRAMDQNFPDGCKVRLFDPLSTNELVPNGVYTVTNLDVTETNDDPADNDGIIQTSFPGAVESETVIVRVAGDATPAVQTIRYRFNNGALERIVNGNTQVLALDLEGVNFSYDWTTAAPQRVRRVDILLRGRTQDLKERDAGTSVTLRNVF